MLEQKPHMKPPFSICGNIPPLWWVFLTPQHRKHLIAEGVEWLAIGRLVPSEPETVTWIQTKFLPFWKSVQIPANPEIIESVHSWDQRCKHQHPPEYASVTINMIQNRVPLKWIIRKNQQNLRVSEPLINLRGLTVTEARTTPWCR